MTESVWLNQGIWIIGFWLTALAVFLIIPFNSIDKKGESK